MSDTRRFEQSARDWLELGPTGAPDRVIQAALLEIEVTKQQRDLRILWRFQPMNRLALFGAAAAIVVAVGLGGLVLSSRGTAPAVGDTSSPSPVPSPSSTSAATTPPASAPPAAVVLSSQFTSPRYGYSMPVAADWQVTPATLTWTGPDNTAPVVDEIDSPDGTGITGASQALLPGETWDQWLATFAPPAMQPGCGGGAPSTWAPIRVGSETGLWQQMCGPGEAVVQHGNRAYVFTYGRGAGSLFTFDEFKQLLAGIQLDESTVPPSATPPPLGQPFVSGRNGFELQVPQDWTVIQQASGVPSRSTVPPADNPGLDVLGNGTLRLSVTSFPLGAGESADAWGKAFCAISHTQWSPACDLVPAAWESVPLKSGSAWLTVNGDSASSFPREDSRLFLATAVDSGRAYEIRLEGPAERELFLAILASMKLDPAAAADATPRP